VNVNLQLQPVSCGAYVCAGLTATSTDHSSCGTANRSLKVNQALIPPVAVEVTLIENWLELEGVVTSSFRRHSTEWSVDLLFTWALSDKLEFMVGVGPEWIHINAYGMRRNSVAAEVAPDLMLWSSRKHRFGAYLEPTYQYKFGPGHEHSLGINGGLLIGIPRGFVNWRKPAIASH